METLSTVHKLLNDDLGLDVPNETTRLLTKSSCPFSNVNWTPVKSGMYSQWTDIENKQWCMYVCWLLTLYPSVFSHVAKYADMRYAAPSLSVRRIPVVNKSSLNERANFTAISGGHCSLPVVNSQTRLSLSSEGMFQRELTVERQTCFWRRCSQTHLPMRSTSTRQALTATQTSVYCSHRYFKSK